MKRPLPSKAELERLLSYDPETGIFRWKVARGRVRPGDIAGKTNKDGYRVIKVSQEYHYAHRLAWLFVTGSWPAGEIDHRNRRRADNRFDNLRDATRAQNLLNQPGRGRSGAKGVSWKKKARKWRVRVRIEGTPREIGLFDDFELAEFVAAEARNLYHGEFACH